MNFAFTVYINCWLLFTSRNISDTVYSVVNFLFTVSNEGNVADISHFNFSLNIYGRRVSYFQRLGIGLFRL